jgi:hypothetical protein
MPEAHLFLANAPGICRTPHTKEAHQLSHVQKLYKQGGWLRENGTAASLGWSGLK